VPKATRWCSGRLRGLKCVLRNWGLNEMWGLASLRIYGVWILSVSTGKGGWGNDWLRGVVRCFSRLWCGFWRGHTISIKVRRRGARGCVAVQGVTGDEISSLRCQPKLIKVRIGAPGMR
jgi:hypothetical protein